MKSHVFDLDSGGYAITESMEVRTYANSILRIATLGWFSLRAVLNSKFANRVFDAVQLMVQSGRFDWECCDISHG